MWNKVVHALLKTAAETVGFGKRIKTKRYKDVEIQKHASLRLELIEYKKELMRCCNRQSNEKSINYVMKKRRG